MKFKFIIILISNVLFYKLATAQNLIPNPSFENYIGCPSAFGQLYLCDDWKILGYDSFGTSYFNSCCTDTNVVSIPKNSAGFQYAATGNAYCGFVNESGGLAASRQYLIAQLSAPLIVGERYYVSLKISLADQFLFCASNKMGVLFSSINYDSAYIPPRNDFAQVYSEFVIGDTMEWYQIKGSFIADSSYNYILIGNFFSESNVSVGSCSAAQNWGSYYYLDDVCVSTDSLTCFTSTGISNYTRSIFHLSPNPSAGLFNLECRYQTSNKITLMTISGNKIIESSFSGSNYIIDLSAYPRGSYILRVENEQDIAVLKIILI
jgi:hypothetical protein